jgi:hypothetical protein
MKLRELHSSSARASGPITLMAAIAFMLAPTAAQAATERLDDTTSSRRLVSPQRTVFSPENAFTERFDAPAPTHATLYFGRVNYRLSTARYIGKRARIYLVIPLPAQLVNSPAGLKLEWRGARMLANGAGRPGDRVLVWQGVVSGEWVNEDIELSMQIELRHLSAGARASAGFESYFEIEVTP